MPGTGQGRRATGSDSPGSLSGQPARPLGVSTAAATVQVILTPPPVTIQLEVPRVKPSQDSPSHCKSGDSGSDPEFKFHWQVEQSCRGMLAGWL